MIYFRKGYIIENFIQIITESIKALSILQLSAGILAILFYLLAVRQSLWCWLAAFISSLIFTIIYFDEFPNINTSLHIYYMIISIFGLYSWKYSNKLSDDHLEVNSYGFAENIKIIIALASVAVTIGFIMENDINKGFTYIYSFIVIFAIFAAFLLAIKILETWIYWIVINIFFIYIYMQKEEELLALLFALFTILSVIALKNWSDEYNEITE